MSVIDGIFARLNLFFALVLQGQIPTMYLIARVRLPLIIGTACIVWGVLMLGTMGCKNFGQILGVRILLGFAEAPLVSACISYTALFYTRKENASRTLIWGAMQVSATALVFDRIISLTVESCTGRILLGLFSRRLRLWSHSF